MGAVTFRRLTRDDFPLLATWLARPHVRRWWNHEFDAVAIERDFGTTVDGADPSEDHLVLLDGAPIGLLQYCRYADFPADLAELSAVTSVPDHAVCIDYLIGDPALTGRGIGTQMIRTFTDRLWRNDDAASCVIVPVVSANEASWRALLRAGFSVAARGELIPDNPIDDPSHVILRLDRPAPARHLT